MDTRRGLKFKGYSLREIKKAGLMISHVASKGIEIDTRRISCYDEYVQKLKDEFKADII